MVNHLIVSVEAVPEVIAFSIQASTPAREGNVVFFGLQHTTLCRILWGSISLDGTKKHPPTFIVLQ
jgi:hypothetical protein